ncbi:MAG: M24 family metallopeptidase [Treponema sp.]|jgi:predicted dehydrogenase/Xaa-Pro aminopeptidase|nr:M24 family metallopeptidase [Treponema sp.]
MELLADNKTQTDQKSFNDIKAKIGSGGVTRQDLRDGFAFFAQICNGHSFLRYEIGKICDAAVSASGDSTGGADEKKSLSFQFNLNPRSGLAVEAPANDDEIYSISFSGGFCTAYAGPAEKPAVIFYINIHTILDIIKGNMYSLVAQMGGYIKYTGNRPDAMNFQKIFEIFLDQFIKRDDASFFNSLKEEQKKIDYTGKVKFGVIGGGQAFFFHSNGDRASPYIAYTAIYDRNFENAKKMAQTYKDGILLPYDDLDAMLASGIDAVLVMVPHVYHVEMVEKCAAAGKHVLCEKPMGTTVEGCRRMIKACKDAGVKFMIAENHRFLPAHVCMHDIVAKGLIGDVLMVRAYEGVNEIHGLSQSGFWKGDPIKAGGGALMDMAAHKFVTIEYVIGSKCKKVTGALAKQAIFLPEKAEDNALAIASYENGALADIMVSFTQKTIPYNSMEVFGTKGSIFENHAWEKPVRFCSFDERMGSDIQKWIEPDVEHLPFPEYYTISVRETDAHFAKCILENKEPEFTPAQAMNAISAILAGYLSHEEGRPVDIAEIEKMADQERTIEILERLAPSIPINKNLPEVKTVEPIGYNSKKAVEVMNRYDLDLLVAASPVNVFYLSGLPLLHSAANPILLALNNQYPNLAMIRREGEGTLVHWNVFKSASFFSWFADTVGIENQAEAGLALRSKIRAWGLTGKRVGVETTCPKFLTDALADAGVTLVNSDGAFLDLRLVKSPLEIEYLQKAADITEAALKDTIAAVKEGVTDLELLKIGKNSMLKHGADDWDHLTMTIGDSDPEAPGTGRAVKKGEIVRLDFGAIYKGYVADINQHVVVGDAPAEADKLIQGLLNYQHYYEDRIKPGVNMKALSEEALEWYKKEVPNGIAFSIGHSIGLQCEDQHIFGAMGVLDRPFEENMIFEIEAWEPFEGALIGVEDCYVVTKDGCRKMTTMSKAIERV